ncbi:MAG: YgfZ/GcvT domain-containing protein [Ilumatobacteraceae bacterium]
MTAVPASWRWATLARDVVLVEGDDARWFLHSQLAQDIEALGDGGSAWSLLLSPDGRVDALLRVVRRTDRTFTLDVERGFGPRVVARLSRFVLRARVSIAEVDWEVRGFLTDDGQSSFAHAGLAVCDWGTPGRVDIVDGAAAMPAGGTQVDPTVMDAVRVDRGWPSMGVDILEGDVPAGTGVLARAVSFTKGCYPGQELVERMDSRGASSPVRLALVEPGTSADGVEVTSRGTERCIARVRRGVDAGVPLGSVSSGG